MTPFFRKEKKMWEVVDLRGYTTEEISQYMDNGYLDYIANVLDEKYHYSNSTIDVTIQIKFDTRNGWLNVYRWAQNIWSSEGSCANVTAGFSKIYEYTFKGKEVIYPDIPLTSEQKKLKDLTDIIKKIQELNGEFVLNRKVLVENLNEKVTKEKNVEYGTEEVNKLCTIKLEGSNIELKYSRSFGYSYSISNEQGLFDSEEFFNIEFEFDFTSYQKYIDSGDIILMGGI